MGIYDLQPSAEPRTLFGDRPQLPYLLPYLAYGLVMSAEKIGVIGGVDFHKLVHTYYPLEYALRSVCALVFLCFCWNYYTKIRWSSLHLGFFVGILGVFQWIGTEYGMQWLLLHPPFAQFHLFTPPTAADMTYIPTQEIADPAWRIAYYVIRIGLPTLIVPVMEELFWRDFMMRALIRGARFQEVAIGTFTWLSLLGTSLLFSLIHTQHLAAYLWALMIGILLIRTKSIGACIVAHATTNFFLYIYVLFTHDWQFW